MSTTCPEPQRGFGIIAAITILVILATLGGFIVSLTSTQNMSFVQDIQGARAYQAARAGIEWQLSTWLNSNACAGGTLTFSDVNLANFTTVIIATPTTSGGINFCSIESTATVTGASLGSPGYIERQLVVVAEGN